MDVPQTSKRQAALKAHAYTINHYRGMDNKFRGQCMRLGGHTEGFGLHSYGFIPASSSS